MNREFKFRAFDNKNKNFFIPSLSEFSDMNDEIDNLTHCGRYKLIQYTGLKDKNGKEVYEGDIIKSAKGKMLRVVFYDGAFRLSRLQERIKIVGNIFPSNTTFTVVGNVFNNPELLEGNQCKK